VGEPGLGASLSHLEIRGLTSQCWTIGEVHLTEGYWVLLVQDEQVAEELTRQLVGISAPRKGYVLLNGRSPHRHPATRATCASVLASEPSLIAGTVGDSLALISEFLGVPRIGKESLILLGLEQLRERTASSLSPGERRQVAFAIAMARKSVELSVYCEPRLNLSAAQRSTLQVHMSELAARCCVLCITSSLHDARQLGGPHARLTRSGWGWLDTGGNSAPTVHVVVEGTGLRPVAADLAVDPTVVTMSLHNCADESQLLQVHVQTLRDITAQIARVSRQVHARVTRLYVDESDRHVCSTITPYRTSHDTPLPRSVPRPSQHCNLVRIALSRQCHSTAKALASTAGVLLVLGEPAATGIYTATQAQLDAAGAVQKSLSFLIAGVVPLGSLLAAHLLTSEPGFGRLLEPPTRIGVSRRCLVSINWILASLFSAAIAGASAALVMLVTRNAAWSELGVAMWIAACGGATYTGIFVALAYLRRTWVQWSFLIADYVLGGEALGISSLFPRGHLLNLLGAPWAQDLRQPVSFIFLGALLVLAFGLTLMRTEN
jgi:energy-coupling factor transporter ATP-binding protein EcfA2